MGVSGYREWMTRAVQGSLTRLQAHDVDVDLTVSTEGVRLGTARDLLTQDVRELVGVVEWPCQPFSSCGKRLGGWRRPQVGCFPGHAGLGDLPGVGRLPRVFCAKKQRWPQSGDRVLLAGADAISN